MAYQARRYGTILDPKVTTALVALIVAITQLAKWYGLKDRLGALVVLGLALILTVAQVFALGWTWDQVRAALIDIIALWALLATSAAGIFGFTRAMASAVTSAGTSPPPGAAQNPTVKL